MNDPAPPPASFAGRHKMMLLGGVLVLLAGAAAIVLLRPGGSSCQGVFEQTAPRLEANIELIRNKGGFAVSQEKVQELTEGAQKVGLHLKTCCSVLDGGKLNPEQFQQCIERASAYEKQVAQAARQIDAATAAQQQGNATLVQQQATQIVQTLQSAASEVTAFEQQITQLAPTVSPAATSASPTPSGTGEPNDTRDKATPLRLGGTVEADIAREDDTDFYILESARKLRDRILVGLANRSETLRPSLRIYGPDRAQLTSNYSTTPGANLELAFIAEPATRYYVEVQPAGTGGYRLSATPQQAYDRHEPNDDPLRDRPTTLAVGRTLDADILDDKDRDWYVLPAAPGHKLRLTFDNRSPKLRPNVVIYNAQRVQIGNFYESTQGASLDHSFDVTPGATYYFEVQPAGTGAYRLTLN